MDINQLNLTCKTGNQIKQGDIGVEFIFELRNYKNRFIDEHDGKEATVRVGKIYQEKVTIEGHEVRFAFDHALPHGEFPVEVHIENYIFPSDYSTYIVVRQSLKDFEPVQLYEVMRMSEEELSKFLDGKLFDDSKLQESISQLSNYSKGFKFEQETPKGEWLIIHNLDKFPQVTVVDSAKSVVIGEVQYLNLNELVVRFAAPFSGSAYLN